MPPAAPPSRRRPLPRPTALRPTPSASVCSRKIRSRSAESAPTAFRMASMSMRCSRCACMAMATPMAPSTMATRQIRLRIAVALSRPRRERGIALAIIHHLRVGQRGLKLLAHCGSFGIGGEPSRRPLVLRQLDEQPPAGAAARRNQAGARQRGLRDHHPRPKPAAAR